MFRMVNFILCTFDPNFKNYLDRKLDLEDLLELTPKKDVLFILGDWNAKVGSQEIPRVTGKFGFGVQNEAGQRLTEFCQEKHTEEQKGKAFIRWLLTVIGQGKPH